jgi:hypothetical protein
LNVSDVNSGCPTTNVGAPAPGPQPAAGGGIGTIQSPPEKLTVMDAVLHGTVCGVEP